MKTPEQWCAELGTSPHGTIMKMGHIFDIKAFVAQVQADALANPPLTEIKTETTDQ